MTNYEILMLVQNQIDEIVEAAICGDIRMDEVAIVALDTISEMILDETEDYILVAYDE